jgi:hypothetical protein
MQALPRAKLKQPEWEIAAETLLAAVEGSGPLMFAEIAMRKAVNAGKKPAPEQTSRRGAAKRWKGWTASPAPSREDMKNLIGGSEIEIPQMGCAIGREISRERD